MLEMIELFLRIWMHHGSPQPIGPERWRPL